MTNGTDLQTWHPVRHRLRLLHNLVHRLTLCAILGAILVGILINLSDAILAVRDLFGV